MNHFQPFPILKYLLLCVVFLVACQNAQALPDRVESDLTAPPIPTAVPANLSPIELPSTPTVTAGPTPFPTLILPTLTPYPDDIRFSIGNSLEGREIALWQFGEGEKKIVLVGGLHGGYEGNTVVLVEQLTNYFRQNEEAVLPGIRLVLIPAANPDGLMLGAKLEGRFNSRGVDLNRNWGCEWSETAELQDIPVDPGTRPFSEPESMALRTYFLAEMPDVVLFYHSAAGGVFLGACGDQPAATWLGKLLEDTTGYPLATFDYYAISGDATNWLSENGIPAAVVELYTSDEPEFTRNLEGVMALQCYFVRQLLDDGTLSEREAAIARHYCTIEEKE